ncbi:MAG TPA: hypothetical protein V6C97_17475 [Oculatellaceae cyanobacterium]
MRIHQSRWLKSVGLTLAILGTSSLSAWPANSLSTATESTADSTEPGAKASETVSKSSQSSSSKSSQQSSASTAIADSQVASSDAPKTFEPGANQEKFPKEILRSGVRLQASTISDNSRQLAEQLKLLPLLQRIQSLRGRVDPTNFEPTQANISMSQQLTASTVAAMQIIDEANLAIDYVLGEMSAEQNIYNEILSTLTSDRDKTVFKTNAVSFITNGILWALAEALDIPTNRHPNYSTSSGTFGILAGVVPSIASIVALYQLNGKKETSEQDPNMLSQILGYPANPEIEYPKPIWEFLTAVPASNESTKTRKDQLIDRWVSDKNIANFTDRNSKEQLDVMTASAPHKKGLSIANLNARQAMLQQLSAEILKMKRLLYELSMAVRGAKSV